MSADLFLPERLRVSDEQAAALVRAVVPKDQRPARPPSPLPRHRTGEAFVKGPIPATWLIAAARLPGKALHVGLALWQRAGVSRSSTVSVGGAFLTALELDKSSKSRALRALEGAGLIVVTRAPGRVPVVTIVEAPP